MPDTSRLQKVTADNIDGINNLVSRGRAFVTAPIIGYDTQFSEGSMGEIEKELIKELNIDTEGFKVPECQRSRQKGFAERSC